MMKNKNILILGYYFPSFKVGGPLMSISNMIKSLKQDFDFKVIAPNSDFGDNTPYPNIVKDTWINVDGTPVFYINKKFRSITILFKQIKLHSDSNSIVYLNSVFNFLFSISIVLAKKIGLLKIDNLIIAPRNELNRTYLKYKSWKKKPFIWFAIRLNLYKNIIWHASTESECSDIMEALKVKRSSIRIALNMTALNSDDKISNQSIEFANKENNVLRIIFLSRIAKEKNLQFVLDTLQKVQSNVILHIYGPIQDENLWSVCLDTINKMSANIEVKYMGVVKRQHIKETFQKYDLFFFPTFGENFGHVIAESLSVGTQVLISDQTPWRDLERDKLGWDYSLSEPDLFINAINMLADCTEAELKNSRSNIISTMKDRLSNSGTIEANKKLFTLPFH
jgi:glycosyltransferase involved in cell wall biosynthesis